jgi:hypothetical protein
MIWHWLNVHLWGPMWPNMFAPSASTVIAVAVSHVKAARQRERHHQDMKQHVTNSTGGPDGQNNGNA